MHDEEIWAQETLRRYGGADLELLADVLRPVLIPIAKLDRTVVKRQGANYYSATFSVRVNQETQEVLVPGATGKFIPGGFVGGESWNEIAKGRILGLTEAGDLAIGEVYTGFGNKKADLEAALARLTTRDLLEIDRYGASAKILSSLVEAALSRLAVKEGYTVRRMPQDCAKHVGHYYYYDFEFSKGAESRRVEAKSLWGTDTTYARLIHSKTEGYETSSCKFDTQDIFAVSLFLRTGNVNDFAFAASCSDNKCKHGLPSSAKYPAYVNQNPRCTVGDGVWFASITEVWNLCRGCTI